MDVKGTRKANEGQAGVPDLEPYCGSWVISRPDGSAIFETFERKTAEKAASLGLRVETAAQYLGRLNREIREAREHDTD